VNSEELIISIVRIVGSMPVLFFPFLGSILAILVDLSDLFLMGFINMGGVSNYQKLDKFLDLFYMGLFLIVSLRWDPREKFISIGLFVFRMLGVILFFIFNIRIILVFFPNVFEFWFVLITGYKYFNQNKLISPSVIFKILLIAFALKLSHEIFIHHVKTLDNYTAIEFLDMIFQRG
jgi:hypothetical protein